MSTATLSTVITTMSDYEYKMMTYGFIAKDGVYWSDDIKEDNKYITKKKKKNKKIKYCCNTQRKQTKGYVNPFSVLA